MSRTTESGQGRIGLVVAIAVVGAAIFLAVKFVPVRIEAYEFRDFIEQECRYAAVHTDDAAVAKRILEKAKELDIPLEKKNLKVRRTNSEMVISASFEKPIDLKVTTYTYRFSVKESAPLF